MQKSARAALVIFALSSASALYAHAVCVEPQVRSACCDYLIEDQYNHQNVKYYAPAEYFADEAAARKFVADKYSRIAFISPASDPDATIPAGWHYNGGSHHSGVDYWRQHVTAGQDVTMPVVAAAAGRVVTVKWDNWFGNTVIIEHTASSGEVYRTLYMHLRNGGAADWGKANGITPPNPNTVDNWTKYKKFAAQGYQQIYWGKNTDLLKVKAGDWVNAGQVIGTSGNTGAGGAGNGLDANGTPTDSIRANNHLHFMLSVHPPASSDWTFIDPYGVYGEAGSGCYSVTQDPAYPRFIQPFYPSFFNLPEDQLVRFFYYWPQIGMGPQTLSLHDAGSSHYASGAFDAAVGSQWFARIAMDSNALTQWFNSYHAQGYRPRQVSVLVGGDNSPRYTVIWQKRANEIYYFYPAMSDADFDQKWKDLVLTQGFHMEDYAAYAIGPVRLHAAIFVKDSNNAFYFFRNMTNAQYQAKFNEMWSQGFSQTSLNVIDFNGQWLYAGIWRKIPGAWATYANLNTADFQQKFNSFAAQGFRWYKVQGYANSSLFGAVWTK